MGTMFGHLDDHDAFPAGPRELARVLNRAADIRSARRRTAAVTASCALLLASVIFFVIGPAQAPLSSSATEYNFNAYTGPLTPGFPVPTTALFEMDFASPQSGFALVPHRGQVVLADTSDGGSTWKVRNNHLPPGLGASAGYPGQIEFVGFTGYLWGSTSGGRAPLWVSHDDGATWKQAAIGPYVEDAAVIGLNVWALTSNCSAKETSSDLCLTTIEESFDGGTTWPVHSVVTGLGTVGDLSNQVPAELARITRLRSYVLTTTPNKVGVDPVRILSFTYDGGKSWVQRTVPCEGPAYLGAELGASGTQDLWFLCGSQPSGGEQSKELFRSSDGGMTWTLTASATGLGTPAPVSVPANPLPLGGYVAPISVGHRNLAIASASTAWLFPAPAPLFKTTDGGKSWQPVPSIANAGFGSAGVGSITFLSATQGWICAYGIGLWHTTDGITWHVLGPS
jgi:photosystem II stability/assembly factor-like uncharacterized protein